MTSNRKVHNIGTSLYEANFEKKKATEIENLEDIFPLFYQDSIINKIVDHTNNRINKTIACL